MASFSLLSWEPLSHPLLFPYNFPQHRSKHVLQSTLWPLD